MTIRSTFLVQCDNDVCDEEIASEELDVDMLFDEFIAHIRMEGWKSHKNRRTGEWEHFCADHKI